MARYSNEAAIVKRWVRSAHALRIGFELLRAFRRAERAPAFSK